ncbi:slit homolog 2 protein-like [Lytechinus variegatus]|uniref:slit homolog 2 protein-like n=1 Tax=Lytechinus variegatus TaxID=7654 RepID=UPI001BB186A2|nr:slit homolog 2 protein-like [Lytechinus variegatus]
MAAGIPCLLACLFLWFVCLGVQTDEENRRHLHLPCASITKTTANCSNQNRTSVPQSLPNTLEVLDLSYNNLTSLHNESFELYNLIRILNIAHNFIHFIESGSFRNLQGMERIILNNNVIGELSAQFYMNNSENTTMILSHNEIREIPHLNGICFFVKGNTREKESRNITLIDFSHNNLTSVNEKDFASFSNCSIYQFKIGNNKITSLPMKVFSGLSWVGKLDMNCITLEHFEVSAFLGIESIIEITLKGSHIRSIVPLNDSTFISGGQFTKLKILKMKDNKIEQVPDYAFQAFKYLDILDLGTNRIFLLTNKSFCGMRMLKVLNLSKNKIRSLPRGAFACLGRLEYINLAQNNFFILEPAWFAGCKSLRNLDLFRSNINEITHSSWITTNLRILNLQYNKLTFTERLMFTGLSHLLILTLAGNGQLYNIAGDTFRDMEALKILQMDNINRLVLNGTFAELTSLTFLDISYIPTYGLQSVSVHQFKHTHALKTLNMSYSHVHSHDLVNKKTKESLFYGLTSLRTLKMTGNKLVRLPNVSWMFSPLQQMEYLDLSQCQLHSLTAEVFKNLTRLRELRLANNELVDIPERAFQNLHNLQNLLLQFNKIKLIGKNLFKGTANLKQLYLQGNQISTVAPNTIIPIHLNVFNIAGNRLTCNCQLTWFMHWLHTTNISLGIQNETLCSIHSLNGLQNKPVWTFHPKKYCGINIILITGVSIGIIAVLFFSLLVYYKRWWINHKIFLLKLAVIGYDEITEDADPDDYEYQLNIMFHDDDTEWVNENLKPALEERMPHLQNIAFGDEDLHPGMYYLNALYHNLDNSFKTALLISNKSVDDAWFITKLRMAVEHVNDTKLDKIILIFLEDIQEANLPYLVRLLLSRNKPCLLVTEDEDGQELFWAQFEKEMRTSKVINGVIPT